MRRGLLIVIEGIDGGGKTTQIELLKTAFVKAGCDVVCSKEPTDGHWGRQLRQSADSGRLSLQDELEFFRKDRSEHVHELINPAIESGKVVILDRYYYSTMAYQGARGANVEAIREMMEAIAPKPDIVMLMDVDPVVSVSRISAGRNEIPNEFEQLDYLKTVRQIFNEVAAADPIVEKVDANQPVETVHHSLVSALINGPLVQPDWKHVKESMIEQLAKVGDN